jgi:hypothetical protein
VNDLTKEIIGAAIGVYQVLGAGSFLNPQMKLELIMNWDCGAFNLSEKTIASRFWFLSLI